ncbi:putative manganese-dependent inorganic diphosphatase [Desulfitobacterium sp.]|uniref:putative manganese-dependent inorganic diphosphatase n=1 Tax=Desulfitobacterium sp. TaxID=49981 RepID=UPI002B203B1F|nr:putative manganese-dependent inorganic diphosphatase [Desulfitobacterium sp.]MEA4901953.1 putative manganese-dependent inorganic diphosphatase [Desulfitobacterium sp.]
MSEHVYVVGHRNPDTDSICAAISFARLKQRMGNDNVMACRAGKVNRETEYVLNAFHVPAPEYLADVNLRVKDMLNGPIPTVNPKTPLLKAWQTMKTNNQKTLPIVEENGRMLGMISVGDLSGSYIENMGDLDFDDLHIAAKNVIETLKGKLLLGSEDQLLHGCVYVGAMHYKTFENFIKPGSIVLVGDRKTTQESALRCGVSALILTGGATLYPDLEDVAREKSVIVISVPSDTFTAARLLPMSAPVRSIMKTEGVVTFQEDDLISEVRQKMLETRYRNYPVLDEQERVVGLISRYDLLKLSRKKLILVDHNEWGQAVNGADQAQVLEVVDHHRVGGIQTSDPISFRNEPVGSTCTIVAKRYRELGIEPEKEIAGIMLAAILSDTVIFKSPTCTETDKEIAAYLEKIAGVNAKEFGVQMFKSSSNLADRKVEELIEEDLKEFSVSDYKVGIGQVSVMGLEGLEKLREELNQKLEAVRNEKGLRYLLLMITDLLEENTDLWIAGDSPEEVAKAFNEPLNQNRVFLPGVLSRKKQVVPPLTKYFLG